MDELKLMNLQYPPSLYELRRDCPSDNKHNPSTPLRVYNKNNQRTEKTLVVFIPTPSPVWEFISLYKKSEITKNSVRKKDC